MPAARNASELKNPKNAEGFDMLNKNKQDEIEAKFREQKKFEKGSLRCCFLLNTMNEPILTVMYKLIDVPMKDLQIDDYNPWGRPGHGAPNEDTLRKRKIFMDVLPPIVLKSAGNDANVMSRPGGGAPIRTKSGKIKNARVEDPELRFQFHGPVRKMVDIDLRYRVPVLEQKAYKEELDQIVREKRCIDKIKAEINEQESSSSSSECGSFRRLGSHPQDNKELYDKFPQIEEAIRLEEITGGIELEPLLAIRRRKGQRWPLASSDVTGILDIKPNLSISDKEYSEALDQQITAREHHKQEEQEEEKMTARKHFENWDTFWGRPGHGAPKSVKVKENLDYILYQLPIIIRKDSNGQEEHDEQQKN